jgi:hypothetical protein
MRYKISDLGGGFLSLADTVELELGMELRLRLRRP